MWSAKKVANGTNKACLRLINSSITFWGRKFADCIRQGTKLGLPRLREQLAAKPARVTNVDPLPDKVAQALYAQPDDDTEAIKLRSLTNKRGAVTIDRRRDIARKIVRGLAIAGL